MVKLKAYKFRLYPNKIQEVLLNKTFGCVRYFWNNQVSVFKTYDKEINDKPIFKTSTELRNEIEWMKEVSAAAIQQKEIDFKKFRKQLFNKSRKKKIGFPQFKKKSNRQSYRLPNQKFKIVGNKIQLEKIGKVKNKNLSKAISDVSWSKFTSMLIYKTDWYGKDVVKVNRFYASSKTCECGVKNNDLNLSDREWICRSCGSINQRDLLAANNILKEGRRSLGDLTNTETEVTKSMKCLEKQVVII